MRKISKESTNAFINAKPFKKSRMKVTVSETNENTTVNLFLHGNLIAYYIKGTHCLYIQNCGWFSYTTKETLNALPFVSIQQKKGEWFLNGETWNGETKKIFTNF